MWILALVAWSLFVWATRIDNIVADESLDGYAVVWRVALALSFVVLAVATGLQLWRPAGPSRRLTAAAILAWWTIGVWTGRGAGIAVGDHDAAFIAVHLVLAGISIALGVLVLRSAPASPHS